MPQDNLYPSILNLDQYDIFLEEDCDNSNYIEIDKLPNTLGYGKHYFLLSWKQSLSTPYQIKNGSKILFEFKDSDGNIIFSDSTNTLPVNGAAICYVWIKKNPLRQLGDRWEITDGPCILSIVYELEGSNIHHNDTVYGRSTFQYEIKKKNPNVSPILFHSGSQLSGGLSISESLEFDNDSVSPYKRSYLHISNSYMKTDGGKVEFIELSYIESSSIASSSAFKSLTTYKLSASGEYFETTSSDSNGLNPLSHIHRVVTPREIRRNKNITFKLRFLNANKEVAKNISENSDISLTYPMDIVGSPFILETTDNLVHTCGSLAFGSSVDNSIRLTPSSSTDEKGFLQSFLSFKEFRGGNFVKDIGSINAEREEIVFGNVSKNLVKQSSGSTIIGGRDNSISSSNSSSIIASVGSTIFSSSNSAIIGGLNLKIGRISKDEGTSDMAGDNYILCAKNSQISRSNIAVDRPVTQTTIIGGSDHTASCGETNIILGGLRNSFATASSGDSDADPAEPGGVTATPKYGAIIGGTYGTIHHGAQYSSIIGSYGLFGVLGEPNQIGTGSSVVYGGCILASGDNNQVHHSYSTIIGMSDKTTTAVNTVYVQNLDAAATVQADTGSFNSLVAPGSIIGYTAIGIDDTSDSYTLTTSMVVTNSDHKVTFEAPPSGKVEISVQIWADVARRAIVLGLSESDTYDAIDFPNSNDTTNEHKADLDGSTSNESNITHTWVVQGLTAGTSYTWWLGARSLLATGPVLRWGGTADGQYPPFIMKATALPADIYTG